LDEYDRGMMSENKKSCMNCKHVKFKIPNYIFHAVIACEKLEMIFPSTMIEECEHWQSTGKIKRRRIVK
jgi:hypothetical protein